MHTPLSTEKYQEIVSHPILQAQPARKLFQIQQLSLHGCHFARW